MTKRMRALIVDDEPLARDCVRVALEGMEDVEIIGECGDGETAIGAIRRLDPELVFLDIAMPGIDAFGVIEAIGVDSMPEIIFITAFDEHATRAFDIHALDYVMKPFDDARLREAVRRAHERLSADTGGTIAERLAALLRERGIRTEPPARRLMIRSGDRIRYVNVDDVDWFQAEGNYVRVHVGSATHLIRSTLGALEAQLDESRFVRIHRSTIVNMDRVAELQPWTGGDYVALLKDRRTLRVSRKFRDRLLRPMV